MKFEKVDAKSDKWLKLELLLNEQFKGIDGYNDLYQISNYGRVKSLKRVVKNSKKGFRIINEKIIKCGINKQGYYYAILQKEGKRQNMRIHRLVANAFIKRNKDLPCINHKDEDKLNNRVDNLEWCNHKYNMNYGTSIERMSKNHKKSIIQYNLKHQKLNEFNSLKDASKKIAIHSSAISRCCKGKQKTCGGYIWEYKEG